MTFDAPRTFALPRLGEVRVGDVRAALGPGWSIAKDVVVSVITEVGVVVTGRLQFARKRSGRGVHVMLGCPVCREPRAVLYATVERTLRCRGCASRRTCHQRLSRTTEFSLRGGRELDRLVRCALLGRDERLIREAADRVRTLTESMVEAAVSMSAVVLTTTGASDVE